MRMLLAAMLLLPPFAGEAHAEAKKLERRRDPASLTSKDFDDRSLLTTRVRTGDVEIDLPAYFNATVFAKLDAEARHVAVRDDGTVYVRIRGDGPNSIVALRDRNGDGVADEEKRFGGGGGTGILVEGDYLYYSTDDSVYRRRFRDGELVPSGPEETVLSGLPEQRSHAAKPLASDGNGHLFTMVGAPSNACMKQSRTKGSPGMKPCPQLEEHGTIWRFAAKPGQRFPQDVTRQATGLRQVVALTYHGDSPYVVQHGRDQLHDLFPELYTVRESAELPAEELLKLSEGFVGGWPYTYYDWRRRERVVAPEYGGDGRRTPTESYPEPLVAFPGHYAPNAMVFYEGSSFPEMYRGAAFIAFHGSWNRAPLPQRGYHVAVVPFENGKPGKPRVFMDGFAGTPRLKTSRDARHRPCGVAVGPNGELYVTDSREGFVWQIRYLGE